MSYETGERVQEFETVDALQDYLERVYGQRNAEALHSVDQCISLFAVGLRDVRQARRAGDADLMQIAIARIGARLFTFTHADDLDLRVSAGLEAKYPLSGCAYCGATPCVCGEVRANAQLRWDEVGQRTHWSLADWQMGLARLYGESNARRGFDYVTGRLSDELVEVMALRHFAPRMKSEELQREYELELADLTAWTLAVGNITGVNVLAAITERYGHGCPTCGQPVCHCTSGDFDHVYDILG